MKAGTLPNLLRILVSTSAIAGWVHADIGTNAFPARVDMPAGRGTIGVAVADLDRDGLPDVVAANVLSQTLTVFRNLGGAVITTNLLASPFEIAVGAVPFRFVLADLDGDGRTDIVVAAYQTGTVRFYRNVHESGPLTAGSFAPGQVIAAPGTSGGITVADLDGDGKMDLIVADGDGTHSLLVLRQSGPGTAGSPPEFDSPVLLPTGLGASDALAADLNADGKPDIFAPDGHGTTGALFQNLSTPGALSDASFSPRIELPSGQWPQTAAIADIDGDGKPDIAIVNSALGTITLYRNVHTGGPLGASSFAGPVTLSTEQNHYAMNLVDLDGDGKPEMLATDGNRNLIRIYRNRAVSGSITADSFADPVELPTPATPVWLTVADLNGDGRPDLLSANMNAGNISLFQNTIAPPTGPAVVVRPPLDTSGLWGGSVKLDVIAGGQPPLAYQWKKDGIDIPDATGSVLVLNSLTLASAGTYTVAVTNALGSAESAGASLAVHYPPVALRLGKVLGAASREVDLPVQISALGVEHSLRFSFHFNVSEVAFRSVSASPSLPTGTTLLVDDSVATNGDVGVTITLPDTATLPAGATNLCVLRLAVGPLSKLAQLAVSFGDLPVARAIADVDQHPVAAEFQPGSITLQPSVVWVVDTEGSSADTVELPVALASQGNEHAIGFSLGFDPSLLSFASVSIASGLPEASFLVVNSSQAAAGRVGVLLTLPSDMTFPPGTSQVVRVRFESAPVLVPASSTIKFQPLPVALQVSDSTAHSIPVTFIPGTVRLNRIVFEGDVAPRPDGDRALTIIDWVQVGRFVAGLDSIQGPGEFQRVDSAPRADKGNGIISVTDWVQAGRYAAGLDAPTAAGGPDAPLPEQQSLARGPSLQTVVTRSVSLVDVTPANSVARVLSVVLESEGDENAVAFSLHFDPAQLQFLSATPGAGASGLVLQLNTSKAGSGQVGVAMALGTGARIPAGKQELMRIQFAPLAAAPDASPVTFDDHPVLKEISNIEAQSLPANYLDATVPVIPAGPALSYTVSDASILLMWPADATGFALEMSESTKAGTWVKVGGKPVLIGGQNLLPVQMTRIRAYYRLAKP